MDLLDTPIDPARAVCLVKRSVDLAVVVTGAAQAARPLLEIRRQVLEVDLPSTPVRLEVDPNRLVQALVILLGNAARYARPGGQLCLSAEVAGDCVWLRLRDSGAGHAQAENGSEPGLVRGVAELLGLGLVRWIAELHGGGVTASSSAAGMSGEFALWLPRTADA